MGKLKRQYHGFLTEQDLADPEFSIYHHLRRPVTTWLTQKDYDLFSLICKRQGVTAAAYLRAMVVDVLAEEGPKIKTLFDTQLEETTPAKS